MFVFFSVGLSSLISSSTKKWCGCNHLMISSSLVLALEVVFGSNGGTGELGLHLYSVLVLTAVLWVKLARCQQSSITYRTQVTWYLWGWTSFASFAAMNTTWPWTYPAACSHHLHLHHHLCLQQRLRYPCDRDPLWRCKLSSVLRLKS